MVFSSLAIKTPDQVDAIRVVVIDIALVSLILTWNTLTPRSSLDIVNFEKVIACRDNFPFGTFRRFFCTFSTQSFWF